MFRRVAQQVLEYLHTPHDLPLAPQHQLLLAQAKMKDKDLEGNSGSSASLCEYAEVNGDSVDEQKAVLPHVSPNGGDGTVVQAALRQAESNIASPSDISHKATDSATAEPRPPSTGTVVLDVVTKGGVQVPSFIGKTVRGAVEAAEGAGLELEAVGSGVGQEQLPAPGTHVGSRGACDRTVRTLTRAEYSGD